jgi:flagellum-specific ATP synthase
MRGLSEEIDAIPTLRRFGRVARIEGLAVEVTGALSAISLGGQVKLTSGNNRQIPCEVVGFRDGRALVMPLGSLDGMTLGARADFDDRPAAIYPSTAWLGRVVDGFGAPADGKGPLPQGAKAYPLKAAPPAATVRGRVGGKLDLGVRAMNAFTTCCRGQRMGIFAGSGVGKSVLLSMLAKFTVSDVNVIGLIGERGREVQEFIEDNLGEEGLRRTVVIVATSDESPLMRRQAAYLTLAVAEYFRDQGKNVLCMIDSITRFAQAQREIGLSAGEPPATKGYPPSVFAKLPALVERTGNAEHGGGSITAFYTVLTEGDDQQDPIADAARAILDGHIVLSRQLAESGHYPAIDIEASISRAMTALVDDTELRQAQRLKQLFSLYQRNRDLIGVGAYSRGHDPQLDEAVSRYPDIEAFLQQAINERADLDQSRAALAQLIEDEP